MFIAMRMSISTFVLLTSLTASAAAAQSGPPDPLAVDMTQPLMSLDGKTKLMDVTSTPENPDCKKPEDMACRKLTPLTLADICVRALWSNVPGDMPLALPNQPPQVMTPLQNVQMTVRHLLATRLYGNKTAHLSGPERDAVVRRIKFLPELGLGGLRAIQILAPDDPDFKKPIE